MFKIVGDLSSKVKKIKRFKSDYDKVFMKIQEAATFDAIETATDLTPPVGNIRGTNTITGTLKGAWATDSLYISKKKNNSYVTLLANKTPYASFVNNGHTLNRHFVPGLIINPYSGVLEKAPAGMNTGIVVGTKTHFIPGRFMLEGALKTYYNSLNEKMDKLIEEIDEALK